MRKSEARKFVKTHIKKYEYYDVIVTEQLIKYWWRIFNYSLFDDKLPYPKKIIIRNFHNEVLGYCQKTTYENNVTMGIRRTFESKKTFLSVLVHEMVHHYEQIFNQKMTHGDTFYAFEIKVKRYYGLTLSEYTEW